MILTVLTTVKVKPVHPKVIGSIGGVIKSITKVVSTDGLAVMALTIVVLKAKIVPKVQPTEI